MKENNILLAEFLNIPFECKNVFIEGTGTRKKNVYKTSFGQVLDIGLKFHSDWNWLMLVVEKIESLDLGTKIIETIYDDEDEYINASVSFRIEYKDCYIDLYGDMKIYENWIVCKECSSKIEATYSACVEFIKWYNESKGEN